MSGFDDGQRREVHNRRVHISVRAASLANSADIANAVIIARFAIPSEMSTFRLTWLVASVLLMANSPRMWWPRCWRNDFVPTRRDVIVLFADVTANAVLILVVLVHATPAADRDQQLVLLTTYAGVMGCGAIVLSTYRSLALMWVWMNFAALTIAVWQNVGHVAAVITTLLMLYSLVLSIAICVLSMSFVARCRAEFRADAERETVRTLLKDFEDDANEWLWECDADGDLTRVSDTFATQADRPIAEIQGINLSAFVSEMLDRTAPNATRRMRELEERLHTGGSFRDLTLPVLVSGRRRWWSLTGHHVHDPLAARWRGIGEDVTVATVAADEVLRLATTDTLTGLMNRHRFSELSSELLSAPAGPIHLAIVDLDNFKEINDTLGHPIGDQLLVDVAHRLLATIEPGAICARIGGDEFAIVRVQRTARKPDFSDVVRAFDDPFESSGTELSVHASVGHAVAPDDATQLDDLFVAADLALYAAKAAGGNRASAFEPVLAVQARTRAALFDELKTAVGNREFVAWFQPQVNLASGRIDAMEALARWEHSTRGIVTPASFIELAEETGLISPIGEQVMEHAFAAMATWPAYVRLAVNVSARQLSDPQFVQRVSDMLRRYDLPAARIDIEVTETTMVQRDAALALVGLRELGVGLSVDDFGTGYASFEALRMIRPSKLKVDRTFVAELDGPDPVGSQAILRAFVDLANALHITSIAEGAETTEQQASLRELGFHYSQGYIDARPAPKDSLVFSGGPEELAHRPADADVRSVGG